MAIELRHIERIDDTQANLRANLDKLQVSIETDSVPNWFTWKDDEGTPNYYTGAAQHYWNGAALTYIDNEFKDVTARGDLFAAEFIKHFGDTGDNNYIQLQEDRQTFVVGGVSFLDMIESTNDYFIIDPSDTALNVGVGTSAPIYKVDVKGTVRSSVSNTNVFTNRDASQVNIEQSGAGDASLQFEISSGLWMSMGMDNSDADGFKIQRNGNSTAFIYDTDFIQVGDSAAAIAVHLDAGGVSPAVFVSDVNGRMGVHEANPAQVTSIKQTSTSAGISVLGLEQKDVDQPFTKLIGTAAATVDTNSFVSNGDVATSTLVGWEKIDVQDDGNQITDGAYYRPFYTISSV